MSKRIIIIGAGFSSLSAACYLAKMGYKVEIFEKHDSCGGRARQLKDQGFTFDIGPTFYWMPDVFEAFFKDFHKEVEDFYTLEKLDPAYRVYFGKKDWIDIDGHFDNIVKAFDAVEAGAGEKLIRFMAEAEENYRLTMGDLVYQPGEKLREIITVNSAKKLYLFIDTIKKQVYRKFKHPRLRQILEFPVLFLGAKSGNTPAFYNFMNYADFKLGTWHPKGGMFSVVNGIESLAIKLGVTIHLNESVKKLRMYKGHIAGIDTDRGAYHCDILLSGADYHFTETLLPKSHRQYSSEYWNRKTFAPSALLFYVGFDRPIGHVCHHTLFFDTDFDAHQSSIYDTKTWPKDPLFYASFPSKTDATCSPSGSEAGIFLIPIAPGSHDSKEIRQEYYNKILDRLEALTDSSIRPNILFSHSFGVNDFIGSYHSYKGNAYGLANTLMQTHVLRPKLKSAKIKNLYFCGQLTVPGPGVPPSLISGKLVAQLIEKYHSEGDF